MSLVDLFASVLLLGGGLLLVVAALGVIVLPDAMARQHAATKAGTLALACLCVGGMLAAGDAGFTFRLLTILLVLLSTLPVSSHLLARAAAREAGLRRAIDDAPVVGDPGRDPSL